MSEGVASSKTVRVFLRMLRVVARTRKLKMNVQIGSMRLHSGCGHREKLKSQFDKHSVWTELLAIENSFSIKIYKRQKRWKPPQSFQ